jgi:serine/threonine protein kinase
VFCYLGALNITCTGNVRDLKPHNILVDANCNIKIADFGISRTFIPPVAPMSLEVATLFYRAPELLLGCSRYDASIDIWSIGVIILDMALSYHIFSGDSQIHVLMKIFR